jgi:uncharacterized protein (TIGR03435 family)
MTELADHELLAQYAQNRRESAEAAFAALAQRHVNLVYSTALRSVGNTHAAQEITQAVFIILANRAGRLSSRVVLPGWLYQTTRLTAANFLRGEIRRQKREQEAFMQSTLQESSDDNAWRQIAPLLDTALGQLGERDRNALVLRFFENKNLREVGLALGASEDAAKMRVNRALEKLRKFFSKRGAIFSAAVITGAISANSVHAAPIGLAQTISATAVTQGAAVSTSTLTLAKGALKLMAWSKMQTSLAAAGILLLAVSATVVTTEVVHTRSTDAWCEKIWAHPNSASMDALKAAPPILKIRPTRYANQSSGIWTPDGRSMYVNANIPSLFSYAYNVAPARIIFPGALPEGGYDYLNSLPADQRQSVFQAELKRQFGLVAHKETRDTDVLLLKVVDPEKLQRYLTKGGVYARYGTGNNDVQKRIYRNVPLSDLCYEPEGYFKKPVLDETGMGQHYDFDVHWTERHWFSDDERWASIQSALTDQLAAFGLELVPATVPLEMLVVEKSP